MLDLAARVQDLLQFKFNSFKADSEGKGGEYKWTMQKTKEERFGYLTSTTMELLKQVQTKY